MGLKSTENKFALPFHLVFLILLIVKFLEVLPKHNIESLI